MEAQRIETLNRLPKRVPDGHKGTFGSVAVIGGSAGMHQDDEFSAMMLGTPALAAMGAIRAGCGLVKIAAPMPIMESVLTLAPFATGFGLEVDHERAIVASSAAVILDELVRTDDVIVVGPGMGNGLEIEQVVMRLIGQEDVPVVVDADGLNALAEMTDFTRDVRATMVLTPHPGEAKRLMDVLSITGNPGGNENERVQVCTEIAQRVGCLVVLKGKGTVVSDGHRVWVCDRGCSAMGVGGTGDVLSGVIGSVIAQSKAHDSIDLFTACAIGVQAHAIAGERWVENHHASGGMIASELADEVAGAIESLRSDS